MLFFGRRERRGGDMCDAIVNWPTGRIAANWLLDLLLGFKIAALYSVISSVTFHCGFFVDLQLLVFK